MKRYLLPALLALACLACVRPAGAIPSTVTPKPSETATRPARVVMAREQQPTITAVPTLSPTPAACVVANTEGEVLNIRRAPSLKAEIIGGLTPGQRAAVITWGNDWHKVTTGRMTGFISSKYCEATK